MEDVEVRLAKLVILWFMMIFLAVIGNILSDIKDIIIEHNSSLKEESIKQEEYIPRGEHGHRVTPESVIKYEVYLKGITAVIKPEDE